MCYGGGVASNVAYALVRAASRLIATPGRSHECERGTQKCVRHIAFLLTTVACTAAPTYQDVSKIFAARCYGCHAAAVKMGSLNLQTYDGLEQGGTHGKIGVQLQKMSLLCGCRIGACRP